MDPPIRVMSWSNFFGCGQNLLRSQTNLLTQRIKSRAAAGIVGQIRHYLPENRLERPGE
jgi:hypothetical protein